jgi:phenylacetate-CoA ligase
MNTPNQPTTIQLPPPMSFAERVFPLKDHPLYGNAERFEDCGFLLPATLADFTNRDGYATQATHLEICPACFFNTSGTTSRSKRIPYSDADLERQRNHEAIALGKLGLGKGDGVISLGAPLPSISGWAIVNGSETAGASVLNTSQLDFEVVFDRKTQSKATIVIGTPIVVREIGVAIQEQYGPLKDVFPNMKTGIIFGDVLPPRLRREIAELWGFKSIYSLYGTVEADVVATESPTSPGRLELMFERLVFEIIPEPELMKEKTIPGYVPKAVDIREVVDGTIGEIIISDLSRDVLPLIRYRIGDVVQVHRSTQAGREGLPLVSVLGRSKNMVFMDDVPLYEMQINSALEKALDGQISEWRLVQTGGMPKRAYQLIVEPMGIPNPSMEHTRAVLAAISGLRPALVGSDLGDVLEVEWTEKLEQGPVRGDAKAARIVLHA